MNVYMEGYYAAMEDMMQALEEMPCRVPTDHDWGPDCLIRRAEVEACLRGFMRGAEP